MPCRTAAVFLRRKHRRLFRKKEDVGANTLLYLTFRREVGASRSAWHSEERQVPEPPANPIEKPNPHLHTLTGVFCSFSAERRKRTEHRPLFTFSLFDTARLRRRAVDGSGTFMSCNYYTTFFLNVKLVSTKFYDFFCFFLYSSSELPRFCAGDFFAVSGFFRSGLLRLHCCRNCLHRVVFEGNRAIL